MVYSEMSLLFRCKKMKTMRFCNKTESVNPLKNRDLGVKSKKWFLKNVAPPEIDKNGQFVMFFYSGCFITNSRSSEFVYHPEFVYHEKKDTVTQNPFFGFNDFWSVTEHP